MKKIISILLTSILITGTLISCKQTDGSNISSDITSNPNLSSENIVQENPTSNPLSAEDIRSITVKPILNTNQSDDIERFLQIISNSTITQEQPENPAGSMLIEFSLNFFEDDMIKRDFVMNSGVLYETLEDGSIVNYLLDRDNGDFDFVLSFVKSQFTQTDD